MVQNTAATTTVLVVEDDPAVAELVRAIVNDVPEWGAIVAYDAPTALRLLQHVPVDVLVVDVNLPGMSGIELLAALRTHPQWPEPPVILMSANVPAQAVDQALGRDSYIQFLSKPFDIDDLLGAISLAIACGGPDRALEGLPETRDRARQSAEGRVS